MHFFSCFNTYIVSLQAPVNAVLKFRILTKDLWNNQVKNAVTMTVKYAVTTKLHEFICSAYETKFCRLYVDCIARIAQSDNIM